MALPSKAVAFYSSPPAGSGKTLAAWNWIQAQLAVRPLARVLFLYPTRATATEGFRDYVSWAPETDAALLTGTADYELHDMFTTPDDERTTRRTKLDSRLFALGHWQKRIFSATADQFFPFLQYVYSPICLLPLLAESVFVVDEVHSFDKSMFSSLKRFLKEFPIPVLCMTATLSSIRRQDLEQCGLERYPDRRSTISGRIAEHSALPNRMDRTRTGRARRKTGARRTEAGSVGQQPCRRLPRGV